MSFLVLSPFLKSCVLKGFWQLAHFNMCLQLLVKKSPGQVLWCVSDVYPSCPEKMAVTSDISSCWSLTNLGGGCEAVLCNTLCFPERSLWKKHRPLPVLLVDVHFSRPSVSKTGYNMWVGVVWFLWQSIGFSSWMELPPPQFVMLFPSRYLPCLWVTAKLCEPTSIPFHCFPA